MRIERIRVDSFGRLEGFDTGPEALPGLVVVLGPNEAGKSTLFHFLTSMLYGFQPATRERNPYAPWDGQEPSGAIGVQLDDGGCVDVERRLRSQPSARMRTDERTEELRNRALPWVAHVPRAVFRQVYALTLGELAGLDEDTWSQIQDRLIGSMGSTDLRPLRHVVADLEQEAGELWRPNRRGNQRIREIQEELLALRGKRREALQRDRRLREVVREAALARDRLQEVREIRQHTRATLHRVQELLPVRLRLRRIAALQQEAGAAGVLEDLPNDPVAALAALEHAISRLEGRLEELGAEREDPTAAVEAVGSREKAALGMSEAVAALAGQLGGMASDRARQESVIQEVHDLERRIEAAAGQVICQVDAIAVEALLGVSAADLRARVRNAQELRRERRILEAARERHRPVGSKEGRSPLLAGAGALLTGVVLFVVGQVAGSPAATTAGAVAATLGLFVLVTRMSSRAAATGPSDEVASARHADEARRREEQARAAVLDLFGDLDLLPEVQAEPGHELVAALERVHDLARDRTERLRTVEALAGRASQADAAAAELAAAAGVDAGPDAHATMQLLERETRRAERLKEGATAAARELKRLEREGTRTQSELDNARTDLATLRDRMVAAGESDPTEGPARLRARIEAWSAARQLRDELERSHPDLDCLVESIRQAEEEGAPWTLGDDALAQQRAREETLSEEIEELAAQAEALERDAAHLREGDTADSVDGEIASLQEQESTLLHDRDRRWILAQLLREADHRFREEHQPDLLRRAGSHLARLTNGRYTRIVAEDGTNQDRFLLVGPGLPGPIPLAPPISTGTLEQAYLALRLAIVDHLDQGLERLPLFVDELFVNWDATRRTQGLDILKALSEERQLFAFTCHAHVAEELTAGGARMLRLDGGT